MRWIATALAGLTLSLPAADILGELAIAAPRDEDHAGFAGSDLGWMALVQAAPPHRIDGVAMVDRDGYAPDGQVIASLCWNHVQSGPWGGGFRWTRIAAQAGSDPLAATAGKALLAIQGMWSATSDVSGAASAAWSADRGAVLAAEASYLFLRVRAERDDVQSSLRFGTGPRFLGSDAPWSAALLADYIVGQTHGEKPLDGGQIEAWFAYRLSRRLLIAGDAQAASHVRSADGSQHGMGTCAIVLGCTW